MSEDCRNPLRGRRGVCEALEQLASQVEGGQSAALVLRGEAGIGKSALLDHLAERAHEHRITRATGAESEMELPFAGLQQVCAPLLDSLHRLPGPQSQALATAFGMSAGPPPDRFLVGLAALGLLTAAAAGQPLFCLVDDAQWLDRVSAQTLAFVARRMHAEPLALVFAFREFPEQGDFDALPDVTLQGLDDEDARLLLESAARGPVDDRLRARILAEARGNPLALLELPRDLTGTELADTLSLPDPGPVAGRVERSFLGRVRSLPPQTQRLLLTAAAEPLGDATLLWRAVEKLGIEPGAAHPAIAARLIDIGTLVRFRHPLLRSAVYRSAGLSTRRETHRVLAEVTDPALDPDRRAWHLARAAMRPDEATAAELESSAGRAQARGGAAAAAAFLARAAILTPEPQRKALRAVAAAQAKLRAGAPEAARELLAIAERGNLNELDDARVDLLHAHIAFASSRGGDASSLLKAAARRLTPLDAALARETFLDAVSAAMFAGRFAGDTDVRDIAQAARRMLPAAKRPRHADLLLAALALRFAEEHPAAAGASRTAVDSLRGSTDAAEVLRWSWLTSALAAETWDDEGWQTLVTRHVDTARTLGALGELPLALNSQVVVHTCTGEFEAASLLVAEIPLVQEASGGSLVPYGALGLAAWQGNEQEADALIQSSMDDAVTRGEGIGVAIAQRARAVLYNGLGKYEQALEAARRASSHPHDLVAANWGLTEVVEAAVRSGNHDAAHTALEQLTRTTDAAGTHWALGTQARSRALLSEGDVAEGLYREAIERLMQTRMESDLARTHLLYGEWLRRENRRTESRDQLCAAHDMFTRFGACAFTERTDRELRATGETVAKRTGPASTALTAQETQIARLARDGLTNTEIGAQLFLSPHTVEWHLRKVFTKLGITSRRQLCGILTDRPAPTAP
ncbi:LuxR family transcriptional regulator [Streptomyces sp. ADI93-02]|uniref:AAA family ATPase n=1 Tax=Streptomyces sp. ADI93-02 TaxID=1522757 RepID=UPI000F54DFC3|nr:LuxR family transcriptional regulator [Streptomyces sp. ADI93-02]